uniref:Uncharacterized protein n=1 Tax=Rhizophora mucronata TaxID=61149 RepID=A0A2P2JG98_RHIMU
MKWLKSKKLMLRRLYVILISIKKSALMTRSIQ